MRASTCGVDEKKEVTIVGQPILILGELTKAVAAHEHLFTHGVTDSGYQLNYEIRHRAALEGSLLQRLRTHNTRQATSEADYEMQLVDITDHFRHSRSSRSGWGLTALHQASIILEKLAAPQHGV